MTKHHVTLCINQGLSDCSKVLGGQVATTDYTVVYNLFNLTWLEFVYITFAN